MTNRFSPQPLLSVFPQAAGMCYSAMVEQKLNLIELQFKARIPAELFEDVFRRRVKDDTLNTPIALRRVSMNCNLPVDGGSNALSAIALFRSHLWRQR